MQNIRANLKHNFMKQLLFRLDFNGILDADIENCIINTRTFLFQNEYKNYVERYENQVNINIPNENILSVNNTEKTKVYSFSSDNNEIIEISRKFLTVTVNIDKKYKLFDHYVCIIEKIIKKLISISPYFKPLRLGIRKINICFINDLDDLEKYFKKEVFSECMLKNNFNSKKLLASNTNSLFESEGFKTNFIRNIQEGLMQKDNIEITKYQIALDIDVYSDDILKLCEKLVDEGKIHETLIQANNYLFDFYIMSLNQKFLDMLQEEDFNDENIEGVI